MKLSRTELRLQGRFLDHPNKLEVCLHMFQSDIWVVLLIIQVGGRIFLIRVRGRIAFARVRGRISFIRIRGKRVLFVALGEGSWKRGRILLIKIVIFTKIVHIKVRRSRSRRILFIEMAEFLVRIIGRRFFLRRVGWQLKLIFKIKGGRLSIGLAHF